MPYTAVVVIVNADSGTIGFDRKLDEIEGLGYPAVAWGGNGRSIAVMGDGEELRRIEPEAEWRAAQPAARRG